MLEGGVELVSPVDTAAIGHHDHLFTAWAKHLHDLVDILPELLSIKVGHEFVEDARGAVLDRADDMHQDPTRDAAPGAIGLPDLAFESFLVFDWAGPQGTKGQAIALTSTPPAPARQSKAPNHRLVFVEQDDLTAMRLLVEDGEVEAGQDEFGGIGVEPGGGTTVAQGVFFNARRMVSRPRVMPVCWASTVASS
jgi:hypothetical protein